MSATDPESPPAPLPEAVAGPLLPRDAFQRGMTVGLFSDGLGENYAEAYPELVDLGVDSVSLIVQHAMRDIRSDRIGPLPTITPSDARLRDAIRKAHLAGLRVMLFPVLYIEHLEQGEWRGFLAPPSWEAWWREYDRFVLRYARIAAEEHVEIFSVGSELCSTEKDRERWLALIRRVRGIFPGLVTYSANWDHLEPVTFSEALDLVGTNTYYEVGRDNGGSIEELLRAWEGPKAKILAWRVKTGKPLIITEAGYYSARGTLAFPWDYTKDVPVDLDEQRRGYEAFCRTWCGQADLLGVYFYIWLGEGGPQDRGYTPRGKPAARVVREFYRPGGGCFPAGEGHEVYE